MMNDIFRASHIWRVLKRHMVKLFNHIYVCVKPAGSQPVWGKMS